MSVSIYLSFATFKSYKNLSSLALVILQIFGNARSDPFAF